MSNSGRKTRLKVQKSGAYNRTLLYFPGGAMDAHIKYVVFIRATYRQFGSDHLYDPAAAARLKTYRLRLAEIIAAFLRDLLPGFEVEVRIDLD